MFAALAGVLLVLISVWMLGCAHPVPQGDPVPARSASVEPPAGLAEAAKPAPSPWQAECTPWLEGAIRVVAERNPEFRGARVQAERDGLGRERLFIAMFVPVFRVNFHLSVTRFGTPVPGEPESDWQLQAESFHGSYHATVHRTTRAGEAFLAFDGWEPGDVEPVAAPFKAAIGHCFQ